MQSKLQDKIRSNPYYKPSRKQRVVSNEIEITTQDLDVELTAPKVRRKRSVRTNPLSTQNVSSAVQEISDVS